MSKPKNLLEAIYTVSFPINMGKKEDAFVSGGILAVIGLYAIAFLHDKAKNQMLSEGIFRYW